MIKEQNATNSIETTPQRVQRKQVVAEEPITARIRRRHEANAKAVEPATPEPANDNHRADNDNRPPLSFAGRIAMERQRTDHEPNLP
jgi:hypothetical protein